MNKPMLKRQTQTSQQHGVTLLELMVAMAVSSFIMLGISNIYLSTKKSYVIHDEFSRIQENGRYATETLSTNIRNAGFFGCASGQLGAISSTLNTPEQSAWNFQTGLMGYEAVGTDFDNPVTTITPEVNNGVAGDWVTAAGLTAADPGGGANRALSVNPDAAITGLAVRGSDILIIRTADNSGVRIDRNNQGAQFFAVNPTGAPAVNNCIANICENDVLLVSDCAKSLIFQATNLTAVGGGGCTQAAPASCFNLVHSNAANTPGNQTPNWADHDYGADSEIMTVVTKAYFVGVNPGGIGGGAVVTEPSLYVRENNGIPQPLVEGIENMQILYGVDTDISAANPAGDGIANRYFSANDVVDQDGDSNTVFEGVVSVKISLLARTPQNLPGINRTAADYAALTYAMVSPASPITINPFTPGVADRRMRKIYNLTLKIRNKSFNTAN